MDLETKLKEICEKKTNQEVCGFMLEKDGVKTVLECANVAPDKTNYYQICPLEVLNAFKNYDKVLCVFHSHPYSDENPSPFDIEMAEHFGVPFWIYSLKTKNIFKYEKN